jgi:hypothetical protein
VNIQHLWLLLNNILDRDFDASFITEVQAQLTKINTVETELDNLVTSSKISKADVVEFNISGGSNFIYNRGSSLVQYLGRLIGVEALYNKYSQTSNKVSKMMGY